MARFFLVVGIACIASASAITVTTPRRRRRRVVCRPTVTAFLGGLCRCRLSTRTRPGVAARDAPQIAEFGDLVDRYDAFLLDQFGVVHDGKTCYEGSAECVRTDHKRCTTGYCLLEVRGLQSLGKRVVVLSNSSKRRRDSVERLQALGCGTCTYVDAADVNERVPAISVFTSGDLVHRALVAKRACSETPRSPSSQEDLFEGVLPTTTTNGELSAFVFGNGDDDASYCDAAGVATADAEEADFLLARGLFATLGSDRSPLAFDRPDACDAVLEIAAERGLPMIVANPDLVRPDGKDSPMPGVLADRYERSFNGRCVRIGKPHPAIYDAALAALAAVGISDTSRVAAVGDSMHHDVLGAHNAGLDSIFVAGGVHAADLGVDQGKHQRPSPDNLDAFFASFVSSVSEDDDDRPGPGNKGQRKLPLPTFVVPGFTVLPSGPPPPSKTP